MNVRDLGDPLGLDHFRQRPTLGFIKLVFSLMRQGTRLTRGKASKNRRPRNNHTSGRLAADRRGFASGVLEIVLLRKGAANDFISSPPLSADFRQEQRVGDRSMEWVRGPQSVVVRLSWSVSSVGDVAGHKNVAVQER